MHGCRDRKSGRLRRRPRQSRRPNHHNARVGLQVHVRAALSHVRVGHCQAALEPRQASPVYHVAVAVKANPALLPPGLL